MRREDIRVGDVLEMIDDPDAEWSLDGHLVEVMGLECYSDDPGWEGTIWVQYADGGPWTCRDPEGLRRTEAAVNRTINGRMR